MGNFLQAVNSSRVSRVRRPGVPQPVPEPLIAPTGDMPRLDAMTDVINRTVSPFTNPPGPEQGSLAQISNAVGGILGLVGAPFQLMDTGFAIATAGIAAFFPSLPATTLTAMHLGPPHAHSHPPSLVPPAPPVPLPSLGATLSAGCTSVLINGVPAARASDVGLAVCCGSLSPAFEVFTGSSNVFIGGSRAARIGDITRHCNPASLIGTFGKVMGAAGVAAGALGAAAGGGATAAAQAAADAVALAISALLGKDPGIPPGLGALLTPHPNVLIGGFPLPDLLEVLSGLMKAVKGLKKAFGRGKKGKAKGGAGDVGCINCKGR